MDLTIGQIQTMIEPYSGYMLALFIIVSALVLIKIAYVIIGRLKREAAPGESGKLYRDILDALRGPVGIGIMLFGIFFALKSLDALAAYASEIETLFTVIFPFYAAYFASRIVGMVIDWYATEVAHKTKTTLDDQFMPIIKRVAYGVIFGIVIIVMLNQLGIRVETLIATLGIGGLAVALALQPTLANFFSGMQMVVDRPLRIGDFVELEAGDRGTVIDIGWRSTRVRTYMNNIVTIPNSQLSSSKIINYSTPTPEIGFAVGCGVAYDSDLEKVERVTMEVAKDVMERCRGVKKFEPIFRYKEFGDSSINFKVVLRTKTLGDSYLATHEFMKALKKRFDKEGIEIAFPQVDVHFDEPKRSRPKGKPVSKGTARKSKRKKR